jgi:Mg/Co/Ni transporter MgtE
MTPKEKAQELFDKFNKPDITHYPYVHNAQQCALIAVDELIESFNSIYDASIQNIEKYSGAKYGMKDYWEEVKQEIEKL